MPVSTDPVALNQWIPCTFNGQIAPGEIRDTMLLGQKVRVSLDGDGHHHCHEIEADGRQGRELPISERFEIIFATLGDAPRPLPEIAEFDEPDRRIANCGSVGVNTSPYRIVENFLDMAHFSFVHTDILGAEDRTEVLSYKSEIRRDVDEVWATDCQFFQPAASPAAAAQGAGQMTRYQYRVMSPFSVMLYKNVSEDSDRNDAIAVFIQPKTETECEAYMTMAMVDDASTMSQIIDFQQTIFLQDRIILENQRPALLSLAPNTEIPTKADLSSIAFRRWLKASGIRFGTLTTEVA
jgi:phenylpropionate dioxygenase-like ring-hydroxylating dioxygenase large terminal subunit